MASPLSATGFLSALRAEGLSVVAVGSWSTHNRNKVGTWGGVNGVMLHHTGPYTTESGMISLCHDGYKGLPGPLCHGVIDREGVIHLVGYGRANHAGGGDPNVLKQVIAESYGTAPAKPRYGQGDSRATDGNAHFYGFECINKGDGKQAWTAKQTEAMVRASAAICRAHGWTAKSVIGHLEWSSQKVDPRGVTMPSLRTRVAERLKHKANWSPSTSTTPPKTTPTIDARVASLEKLVAAQEKRLAALEKKAS